LVKKIFVATEILVFDFELFIGGRHDLLAQILWPTQHQHLLLFSHTSGNTRTISLIAGCIGGIEPIFSIFSKRRALDWEEFIQLHPLIERLGAEGFWLTDKVRVLLAQGIPPREISDISQKLA